LRIIAEDHAVKQEARGMKAEMGWETATASFVMSQIKQV
jgi:hypothetical protein